MSDYIAEMEAEEALMRDIEMDDDDAALGFDVERD